MDDRQLRRVPRQPQNTPPAQEPNGLGTGLGLLFGGAWFLVFSSWQSLPAWSIWVFRWIGFGLVLLGLLFLGFAVGALVTRRRSYGG